MHKPAPCAKLALDGAVTEFVDVAALKAAGSNPVGVQVPLALSRNVAQLGSAGLKAVGVRVPLLPLSHETK